MSLYLSGRNLILGHQHAFWNLLSSMHLSAIMELKAFTSYIFAVNRGADADAVMTLALFSMHSSCQGETCKIAFLFRARHQICGSSMTMVASAAVVGGNSLRWFWQKRGADRGWHRQFRGFNPFRSRVDQRAVFWRDDFFLSPKISRLKRGVHLNYFVEIS